MKPDRRKNFSTFQDASEIIDSKSNENQVQDDMYFYRNQWQICEFVKLNSFVEIFENIIFVYIIWTIFISLCLHVTKQLLFHLSIEGLNDAPEVDFDSCKNDLKEWTRR